MASRRTTLNPLLRSLAAVTLLCWLGALAVCSLDCFGGNAHCPNGLIVYGDQPAISIQLHPEFDPSYAAALIEFRRGSRYSDEQADAAVASLEQPNDRARLGEWIDRFLANPR